ncbi:hypothetical protein I6A60_16805 [Frankia sp. AgB1.9]|uniref:hypothetical protein n=1 Tax=unclassified Frankia TaxID=2632575 RepID=UPI001EE3AE84|nr:MULTISPECIES: hypothetical protein [unclassified Frankia]MBL7549525.1 hypothetical protein [Frankia sp. AgB1.9]
MIATESTVSSAPKIGTAWLSSHNPAASYTPEAGLPANASRASPIGSGNSA